eukprot:1286797-Alexandrium_andersonii.AAC.1
MWITTPRRFRACASDSESQRMKLSAALGRKGRPTMTQYSFWQKDWSAPGSPLVSLPSALR